MTATLDDYIGKCDLYACRILRRKEYTDWLERSERNRDFSLFVHCEMVNCHEQFWYNLVGTACDICLKYICDNCGDGEEVVKLVDKKGFLCSLCKYHIIF